MNIKRNNTTFITNDQNIEFWEKFNNGDWEKETFQILDNNINSSNIIVDIGAWIGPISLYLASKVKYCYSFEPDPKAYSNFSENLKLNESIKNIKAFNKAITTDGKDLKLYSRHSHGDSGSSILKRIKSTNRFYQVESITFKDFIVSEKIDKLDLIKMDIEGGEFFVIPSMLEEIKRFRPTMLISFHYDALVEYYMQKIIPFGILRRIYRIFNFDFIKNKAKLKMIETVNLLGCKNITDQDGSAINISKLYKINLSTIDMLLFKWN